MACLNGDACLSPQAVREHLSGDWKILSFATSEEISTVTGFTKGVVAPLCLPEEIPVVFDEALSRCDKVNISSGDPMAGLELDAKDLIRLSRASLGQIAAPNTRTK